MCRMGLAILLWLNIVSMGDCEMARYHIKNINNTGYLVPDTKNHLMPRLGDFSISLWVRCSSTVFGGESIDDFSLWIIQSTVTFPSVKAQFRIRGDTGAADFYFGEGDPNIVGSIRLSDEQWHHVVFSCDRDSETGMKLYVDGYDDSTSGNPDPRAFSGIDIKDADMFSSVQMLGYWDDITEVSGRADQIQFYRTVLSIEQIREIYNNGYGKSVDETEFAAISDGFYSELDDGEGEVASGRVCIGGEWSDSNLSLIGGTYPTWEEGGVPFPKTGGLGFGPTLIEHAYENF